MDLKEKTIRLIDDLKATCQSYGLGNDGNEYKIITQIFLYKFLNDKFGYELKKSKTYSIALVPCSALPTDMNTPMKFKKPICNQA